MARINLSTGLVFVGVKHIQTDQESWNVDNFGPGTKAWLETPKTDLDTAPTVIAQGRSMLKDDDRFTKSVGRKYAAMSLLRDMRRKGFNRQDRGIVFKTICPQFFKPKTPKKTAE